MKKLFFLLFAYTSISFNLFSQDYWHRYDSSNSTLLNNRVNSVVIGPNNIVWTAYNGSGGNGLGVAAFDGSTWIQYNTSNSGLLNNDVRAIVADHSGNMWFGCYNAGLVKFDGAQWTTYTTSNSGIVGNNVSNLMVDSENNLWIGAYFDGVSKYNGTNWINYNSVNAPFPSSNCVNDLAIDTEGNLFVGLGCGAGLAKLKKSTDTWTTYNISNSEIAHHYVSAVISDNLGRIWVGYTNKNVISVLSNEIWTHYNPFPGTTGGVAYDGFALDQDGNILCSTISNGLFKFDGAWSQVPIPETEATYSSFSQSVAVDPAGKIWWVELTKGIWTNAEIKVPKAPVNLKTMTANAQSIMLTWGVTTTPITTYQIERKGAEQDDFVKITTLSFGTLMYANEGLEEGVSYEYRIRAFNEYGGSMYSNISIGKTNNKPSGSSFTLSVLENEMINLSADDFKSRFTDLDPDDTLNLIQLISVPDLGALILSGDVVDSERAILVNTLDDVTFQPFSDVSGETTFSFTYYDGKDHSEPFEVIISIAEVEDPVVSTSEDTFEKKIYFYPNPTTDNFTIVNQNPKLNKCEVIIYDLLGRILMRKWTDGEVFTFEVKDLSSGPLIFELRNESGQLFIKRIIKE